LYAKAGIKPADVDFCELHDCFSIASLIAAESLGFWDYGKSGEAWVKGALAARAICGSKEKAITKDEGESLRSLSRGVYALRDIDKGSVISRDSVFFAMPCAEGQLTSGQFQEKMVGFPQKRTSKLWGTSNL